MKNKLLLLLAAAFAFVGCHGQLDDTDTEEPHEVIEGAIEIVADRDLIISNGSDYATLRVVVTDAMGIMHDVSPYAKYYISGQSKALESNIFTTSEAADYEIYATYGEGVTECVVVSAIDGIADLPADSGSGELAHRVLLIQHTGTDCPACPRVISTLKTLSEDAEYKSRYCHVASHSYYRTDPGYNEWALRLSRLFCSGYYPDVTFNYNKSTAYTMEPTDITSLRNRIKELQSPYAAVGVSASVTHKDGKLYVNAEVKSEVTNEFRLAIWVLEDGVYGEQVGAVADWQHIHENVLRKMHGEGLVAQIYGESIGKLKAGQKSHRIFTVDCEQGWNVENCKVVILITSPRGDSYELENVAVCPVGGSIEYAYN